jgi:site-specific DNA-methyltransferase (adenine-specific)
VLDPFCGSGTTCLAAKRLERHFVGYEINPDYVRLAESRLADLQGPPTKKTTRRPKSG